MYTVRVFYGPKIVGEEVFKAQSYVHACKLAEYTSRTIARDCIPLWMWNPRLVTWLVLEPVAA